ncbi:MAG: aminotransferase class I/II-fold pyridoxal phosphate-dependent enzyme, partial [Dorea sp.]|uniref:aminotransferase class I/II-fold pyridoxal phosphate-dependent enzyme n=1 Tax=Dorea sp. TaxID=2040332 RepID=UPI00283B5DAF
MKYDFTTIMDRVGKDAIAVDVANMGNAFGPRDEAFDFIPMWIADMNFGTVPTVQEAIGERLAHPAYGYFMTREEYYQGIINWQKKRNAVEGLTKEAIGYENGVLGGLVSALNAFANPGDSILVHSPTYIGFTGSITGAGYKIVLSELKQDEAGIWRMDYEDMDKKLKE